MNKLTFYLREIKYRFFYIFLTFLLAFLSIFFIIEELLDDFNIIIGKHFVLADPGEYWLAGVWVAVYLAFLSTVPFFFYNYWNFMSPALYVGEKIRLGYALRFYLTYAYAAQCFNCFVYPYLIFSYFVSQEVAMVTVECVPNCVEYVYFVLQISSICFVISHMPLLAYICFQFNMLNIPFLVKNRFAFYAVLNILCASVSPPCVQVQIFMAFYLVFFYELTLIFSMSLCPDQDIC